MPRKKLISANWKMQKGLEAAVAYATRLASEVPASPRYDMVIFPPFLSLPAVAERLRGTGIGVGAQDLFWEKSGAFTGEISGEMVLEAGGTHVIVGHSERRHVMGDDDEVVRKKLFAALEQSLVPVLCVGEKLEHRESGRHEAFVGEQLESALTDMPGTGIDQVIIAYEPVWAIGTGKTATPGDAVAMHARIRGFIHDRFGGAAAGRLRILYGGSVKPENARDLLREEEIDGALVGGASLEVDSFLEIADAVL